MKKYKNRIINIVAFLPVSLLTITLAIMSVRHASEEAFLKVVPAFTLSWIIAQAFLFFEIGLVGVILYKDVKEKEMKKHTIKWINVDSMHADEERKQEEEQ